MSDLTDRAKDYQYLWIDGPHKYATEGARIIRELLADRERLQAERDKAVASMKETIEHSGSIIEQMREERDAALAEIQRLRAKLNEAERNIQYFVDHCIHYRNLAIYLGAAETDMKSDEDRRLYREWDKDDRELSVTDTLKDTREMWEELDGARNEIQRLREQHQRELCEDRIAALEKRVAELENKNEST